MRVAHGKNFYATFLQSYAKPLFLCAKILYNEKNDTQRVKGMKRLLSGWKLKGFWQNDLVSHYRPEWAMGVTDWIEARVPGGVHDDLLRAGLICDPMVDRNSLACEWVENKWWVYRCTCTLAKQDGKARFLLLHGVDYRATVTVNGQQAGTVCGMYRTHRVPITALCREGENEICVILEDAPRDEASYGHTARSNLQKGRFNYKWDFCTRLVNVGLYDTVQLHETSLGYIEWHKVTPVQTPNGWRVDVSLAFHALRSGEACLQWRFAEQSGTLRFDAVCGEQTVTFSIDAGERELWWPNGHGKAALYPLSVCITDGEDECDAFTRQVGFRTLEYRRTEGAGDDALPYTAVINGKPIYLKGVNLVPFDMIYGRVSDEGYAQWLQKIHDANVNTVRVWGGGLIEKEIFYDLCDRLGIMVWQDFCQSSSGGFADFPSKEENYLQLLEQTARFAVRQKRNHVCLTYWCGGNELTDERYDGRARIPVGYDDANIALLHRIVQQEDAGRLMLPSTASGPSELLDESNVGRQHDVHGPWIHVGLQAHYSLLNRSTSMLHSEMGVDGMSSLESIRKFLSPQHIGALTAADDVTWCHHAFWDTYAAREKPWLGTFTDEQLPQLITCSQFFQAEGVRYMIEANRRRMFCNTGSIIWQFNEPFPNVACTNLVDYYGTEKPAYYFVKNSYRLLLPSARYQSLTYRAGEQIEWQIHLTNEGEADDYTVQCCLCDAAGNCLHTATFQGRIEGNTSAVCGVMQWTAPAGSPCCTLTLTAATRQHRSENRYLFLEQRDGGLDRESICRYMDKTSEWLA